MKRMIYKRRHLDFMRSRQHLPALLLAEEFNREFGTSVSATSVQNAKRNHSIGLKPRKLPALSHG